MMLRLLLFLSGALLATPGWAGDDPFPGFCAGVVPPPPDAYEPNDSMASARPINLADQATVQNIQLHSFHSDGDEDWLTFRGLDFASSGKVYSFQFDPIGSPLGAGISLDLMAMEGTGLCLRMFNSSGDELIPPGVPGTFDVFSQCIIGAGTLFEWQFQQEEDYFLQVFQARNSNQGADNFCIPAETHYSVQMFEPVGDNLGIVRGTVRDADSGQVIGDARIAGDGIFTFVDRADGTFVSSDTAQVDATADVIAPGYQDATIQYTVVSRQTTTCDISLTPVATGSPDLTVSQPGASANTVAAGTPLTITANAINDGDGPSPGSSMKYLFSSDPVVDLGDLLVAVEPVPALSAGSRYSGTAMIQAPYQAGIFYTGACVDAVGGESDSGNNCFGFAPVIVEADPEVLLRESFEGPPVVAGKRGRAATDKTTCVVL